MVLGSSISCVLLTKKLPLDHPDSAIFYRHALFHSEGFNRYTMNQLWQTQLNLRVNQIRNLAGSISVEKQAEALQACLVALDRICLTLMQAAEDSPQKPGPSGKPSSEPKELLDRLLTPRKKLSPSGSHYKLKNLSLTYPGEKGSQTISLKAAFRKLQCTKFPDKELMKQTRIAYMRDLAARVPLSNFEKKYTELSDYLDYFDTKLDEELLTAKIIEDMKPVLATKIYNCCCSPSEANEAIQQKKHPLTYFEAFLSDESEAFIQESAKIFEDSIELVHTSRKTGSTAPFHLALRCPLRR